jgi:multiple sugar transport system permease protein
VVLPLVTPGIAAAAVFTFVLSWNEVFAASILTIQNRTLPAQVLATLDQSSLPYQFAGGFFMMIPALIFIFFVRNYLFNMWGQISK